MKILFLTQYCPPEVGAPQNRIFEFAKQLKKLGHDITILTAMPNYPKGEIFEGYKGKLTLRETIEGIDIIRTWIYATKNTGFIPRIINYLSFTITSVIFGLPMTGKQDVVITESPPLFLGYSGFLISRLKGAKYVFNVSDLWPESAIKLGVLNDKLLIGLSTWLEEFSYKKSHLITGQTMGIVNNIIDRGFGNGKVHLITNGVDSELFKPQNRNDETRRQFNIEGKFAVCYAGIHGIAQGLEIIINTAKELKGYKDISFVFIGEGPEKEKLMSMVKEFELDNVQFYPLQPKKNMPNIIASMDATIIPLKKLDLFKGALPSKMFEALSSELPIILSVEGEAEELIKKAKAGICVEPENHMEVKDAVLKLYENPELCKELGENGRKYVMENYSRQTITKRFESLLIDIMKK
ncbi:alpha-D-kanosaminyltransferase [Oxobacter pfennigii]|uniref:Alpha-D-kanosaminyltransferase n=1 Tax=Oxobacter pfennigii TaxID=36849 RepID=A0A0P9AIT1_9CLOT|nr:glycosyltransferase family 4 protein [Oxobacter pfennigii]KPU45363.1 alpha-D-kanosaminyltransferase [Oxobacter pfennigii]